MFKNTCTPLLERDLTKAMYKKPFAPLFLPWLFFKFHQPMALRLAKRKYQA
jgi:hypothetical protein